MKLVINVDNYKLEACKRRKEEGQNAWYHDMVLNGKPLEKEIVKELEKIKEKINLEDVNCQYEDDYVYSGGLQKAIEIIDNHISELKGE